MRRWRWWRDRDISRRPRSSHRDAYFHCHPGNNRHCHHARHNPGINTRWHAGRDGACAIHACPRSNSPTAYACHTHNTYNTYCSDHTHYTRHAHHAYDAYDTYHSHDAPVHHQSTNARHIHRIRLPDTREK